MSDRPPGILPLPTLDEIAERPDRAAQLPPAAVQAMLYRALVVQQACVSALLAYGSVFSGQQGDGGSASDGLVPARVVAQMMGGISARAVYRQARHFPFSSFTVRPTPGTIRFRRALVEEYLRDPDAYRVRHAGSALAVLGSAAPRKRAGTASPLPGLSDTRRGGA